MNEPKQMLELNTRFAWVSLARNQGLSCRFSGFRIDYIFFFLTFGLQQKDHCFRHIAGLEQNQFV
jgi:hypothetical protein